MVKPNRVDKLVSAKQCDVVIAGEMPEKEADFQAAMSAGLPLQFPSAFATFHAPLPVDQRTHEGRYVWDPRMQPPSGPFHPPVPPGYVFNLIKFVIYELNIKKLNRNIFLN